MFWAFSQLQNRPSRQRRNRARAEPASNHPSTCHCRDPSSDATGMVSGDLDGPGDFRGGPRMWLRTRRSALDRKPSPHTRVVIAEVAEPRKLGEPACAARRPHDHSPTVACPVWQNVCSQVPDRVSERRPAVALARHFWDGEGLNDWRRSRIGLGLGHIGASSSSMTSFAGFASAAQSLSDSSGRGGRPSRV